MTNIATESAALHLPEDLEALVYNLAWSWHPKLKRGLCALTEADDTYAALRALPTTAAATLEARRDHADVKAALAVLPEVTPHKTPTVAYFCAEFGVDPALPIYSGGLGILAGDHLKSASDLDLPLLGVGLLYRRAYFHQTVGPHNEQQHNQERIDLSRTPVRPVKDPGGKGALVVEVPLGERSLRASVWLAQVGRTSCLLLDTDRDDNPEEFRGITHSLYVGSREARLCQEIVLGIGGVRALTALGIEPDLYHLNEGHSALLLLERLRLAKEKGVAIDDARRQLTAATGFTIHTPVPAGNERFERGLFDRLLGPYLEQAGLSLEDVHAWGAGADNDHAHFDMTAFGLRHAHVQNGVSQLHGQVAHDTWKGISASPLFGLTNGVHPPTWVGPEMGSLYVEAGLASRDATGRLRVPATTIDEADAALRKIGDDVIWQAHLPQKRRLFHIARHRHNEMLTRHGHGPSEHQKRQLRLDPDALTIGFARRFATYKRATLIFRDLDRLIRMVSHEERPVQFLFAGKAHPADAMGQGLIKEVLEHSQNPALCGRVAYIEGYNMPLGQALTQGVDVWLNNPRRPREASGTSGMKAAMNGAPNLSILDGWWDEGFDATNGWAIGEHQDPAAGEEGDAQDAGALYDILEQKVIPAFYDDGGQAFRAMARRAMATSLWQFSSDRMVSQYNEKMYGVSF